MFSRLARHAAHKAILGPKQPRFQHEGVPYQSLRRISSSRILPTQHTSAIPSSSHQGVSKHHPQFPHSPLLMPSRLFHGKRKIKRRSAHEILLAERHRYQRQVMQRPSYGYRIKFNNQDYSGPLLRFSYIRPPPRIGRQRGVGTVIGASPSILKSMSVGAKFLGNWHKDLFKDRYLFQLMREGEYGALVAKSIELAQGEILIARGTRACAYGVSLLLLALITSYAHSYVSSSEAAADTQHASIGIIPEQVAPQSELGHYQPQYQPNQQESEYYHHHFQQQQQYPQFPLQQSHTPPPTPGNVFAPTAIPTADVNRNLTPSSHHGNAHPSHQQQAHREEGATNEQHDQSDHEAIHHAQRGAQTDDNSSSTQIDPTAASPSEANNTQQTTTTPPSSRAHPSTFLYTFPEADNIDLVTEYKQQFVQPDGAYIPPHVHNPIPSAEQTGVAGASSAPAASFGRRPSDYVPTHIIAPKRDSQSTALATPQIGVGHREPSQVQSFPLGGTPGGGSTQVFPGSANAFPQYSQYGMAPAMGPSSSPSPMHQYAAPYAQYQQHTQQPVASAYPQGGQQPPSPFLQQHPGSHIGLPQQPFPPAPPAPGQMSMMYFQPMLYAPVHSHYMVPQDQHQQQYHQPQQMMMMGMQPYMILPYHSHSHIYPPHPQYDMNGMSHPTYNQHSAHHQMVNLTPTPQVDPTLSGAADTTNRQDQYQGGEPQHPPEFKNVRHLTDLVTDALRDSSTMQDNVSLTAIQPDRGKKQRANTIPQAESVADHQVPRRPAAPSLPSRSIEDPLPDELTAGGAPLRDKYAQRKTRKRMSEKARLNELQRQILDGRDAALFPDPAYITQYTDITTSERNAIDPRQHLPVFGCDTREDQRILDRLPPSDAPQHPEHPTNATR